MVAPPYEEFRVELEVRRATLQRRLASVKDAVTRQFPGDSAEQAQERENDQVVDAIGNKTRQSLRAIQVALDKIAEGTYGECERCGEDIAVERLRAIPEARCCVKCAD